jgi:hypothetical protein
MLKRRRVRAVAAVGAFAVAFGLLTGPGDPPAVAAPIRAGDIPVVGDWDGDGTPVAGDWDIRP